MSNPLPPFWGKTDGRKSGPAWHPSLLHMLDVGSVAEALLTTSLPRRAAEFIAGPLGISVERVGGWVSYLTGLHDVGKISPGFQRKVPALYPTPDSEWPSRADSCGDHTAVSFRVLFDYLQHHLPRVQAKELALALSGHHGSFPDGGLNPLAGEGGRWGDAREACIEALRRIFQIDWHEPRPSSGRFPSGWLMMLAGLTSVADWLGSDQQSFPLCGGREMPLPEYLAQARSCAANALRQCGWIKPRDRRERRDGFAEIFPGIPGEPNEMQVACARLARNADAPFLLLVEAPMGQGKTEAALWAAELASQRLGQTGIYYALPTQATSNQMFLRFREYLCGRFPDDNTELHLLHGLAELNEAFGELRGATRYEPTPTDVDGGAGTIQAHEWFRARKRGLLAPFAVGTVDQALLGALTTRHMFVRLFGLAHKTVIIDEVHAYDTYMSVLLDRLIEWLAVLGSNVIVLSATLPKARREDLLSTFAGAQRPETKPRYPCIQLATEKNVICDCLPVTDQRVVRLVSCEGGIPAVLDRLASLLADGGCAAWICNTVGHAQQAFRALEDDPRFTDLGEENRILFHARFLVKDRLRIERIVLDKFGKPRRGQPDRRPSRAIVVATQVIEQSLDLDFDVMVTELPPIDLLLQRMGRLQRHRARDVMRPASLKDPRLFWMRPESDAGGRPDFGASGHVYEPYILLRTLRLLSEKRSVRVPGDVEEWIEEVYGDADEREPLAQDMKRVLQENRLTMTGAAQKSLMPAPDVADGVLDQLRRGVLDDDDGKSEKLTRLSMPTVTIVCLHEGEGGKLSFAADGTDSYAPRGKPDLETIRKLLEHSVRIDLWRWDHYSSADSEPRSWADVALLRNCRLARLRDRMLATGARSLALDARLGVTEGKVSE